MILFIFNASAATYNSGSHLIMLYDHGKKTTFETDKATVGEALNAINVKIAKSDSVEPSCDTKLSAKQYYVNIYRSRPVLVVDGNKRELVLTAAQTPTLIAKAAKITLYSEDKTTVTRNNNYTADGAGITMSITRAKKINITLYGKAIVMRTQADTISGFLKEKNIILTKNDRVSDDLSSKVTSDMSIRIWREGVQTITVEEPVQYDVQQIQDGDQLIGYKSIQTQGVLGKKNVTYTVVIQDGIETSRQQIASVVIQQPVNEVDVIGVKVKNDSLSQWLYKLRECESGGDYSRNSGNGYYGAYQFSISTWNRIANMYRTDLYGVLPSNASPSDQDAMIIYNTNASSGGLATQNPGCYNKTGISKFPQ